jgi:5-aminopentanamidase
MATNDLVRVAGVQMEPIIMANRENLAKIVSSTRDAAKHGARLIVFPECALSGYVFSSREEAIPFMETIPGPATNRLSELCKQHNVYAVVGLLEIDGRNCYNAAVLIGPDGLIGKYRKIHLPFLGIDRFVDHGDQPFQVYQTAIGKIGLHICYDCSFPESARVMTLQGADILALPTNWPEGRGKVASCLIFARAYENKVNFVAVDRVGLERGTRFIGLSKIINVWGDSLAEANGTDEQTIYADVDMAESRQKRTVIKPGEIELDFIGHRRPELYGKVTERQVARKGRPEEGRK